MDQVEELFTIDIKGVEDPFLLNEIDFENKNTELINEEQASETTNKFNKKEINDEKEVDNEKNNVFYNKDLSNVESLVKSDNNIEIQENHIDKNNLYKLNNSNLIEEIKNMRDEELENMISMELWSLYKEMGTSVWPSFLRYENPPQHIKMLESRFYLEKKSKESKGRIVFADIKDKNNKNSDKSNGSNYLENINCTLKELSKNHTYKSILFNEEKNTRIGLITLYLITNGIKKSNLSNRCQFCGSSKCDRKAINCKSNRCFKCLLKGHQLKECKTKYGYFNQNYLLPIRAIRESHFKTGDVSLFDNISHKNFEIKPEYSKYCICFNCDKTGHINCDNNVPMISDDYKFEESMISGIKDRFVIYPENISLLNQQSKNFYLKNSNLSKSSNLFNISYLINFIKENQENDKKKKFNAHEEQNQYEHQIHNHYNRNNQYNIQYNQYQSGQYLHNQRQNQHKNFSRRNQHQKHRQIQYNKRNTEYNQCQYLNQFQYKHNQYQHFSICNGVTSSIGSDSYVNHAPNSQIKKRKKFNDGFHN